MSPDRQRQPGLERLRQTGMIRRHPQQTAWTVIILAFTAFCTVLFGCGYGLVWWLTESMQDQTIALSGETVVQLPNAVRQEIDRTSAPVGSTISTEQGPASQANITFLAAADDTPAAIIQMFDNTRIVIVEALTPRYASLNTRANTITIRVDTGRLRIITPQSATRPSWIVVLSSAGSRTVINQPGTNVSVDNTSTVSTRVTVREGQVSVSSDAGGELQLAAEQSATIDAGQPPRGPEVSERNLINNGDFRMPLEGTWVVETPPASQEGQLPVSITVLADEQPAVRLARDGVNFVRGSISQPLNVNVSDFTSLRLSLDARVLSQSLSNCGQYGTECPVMVRLFYQDPNGSQNEWVQGFYYRFSQSQGSPTCLTCGLPAPLHIQVQQGVWLNWTSPDLLQALRDANRPMNVLLAIQIEASGHSFDSEVTQIQLLARE